MKHKAIDKIVDIVARMITEDPNIFVDESGQDIKSAMARRTIVEESEDERQAREAEARKRAQLSQDYWAKHDAIMATRPKNAPPRSPEYNKWFFSIMGKVPDNPVDGFRNSVYDIIDELTGRHMAYGQVIDLEDETNVKNDVDEVRVQDLMMDCWADGSSVKETASMIMDLLKSMGHI
jgi:hypothetical protein